MEPGQDVLYSLKKRLMACLATLICRQNPADAAITGNRIAMNTEACENFTFNSEVFRGLWSAFSR